MVFLIPNPIAEGPLSLVLPEGVVEMVRNLRHFVVEDVRTARRFLSRLSMPVAIDDLTFFELNEHTTAAGLSGLAVPLREVDLGLLSEAGAPGVADPGSDLVRMAHAAGVAVKPLTGPSSLLLALMASGLNGQNFAFRGYLPVKRPERMEAIRAIERKCMTNKQTQMFIETPYRNDALLADLLSVCRPDTWLCVATNISSEQESIRTLTVREWIQKNPAIGKSPTVFLLGT